MSDGVAAPRQRRVVRQAGLFGAAVGVAAAGVAVGVAAERLLLRRRSVAPPADPLATESFGALPYDETLAVTTADGLDLHVEIVEPNDGIDLDFGMPGPAEPTLIFIHGFCLDMGTFHFQL